MLHVQYGLQKLQTYPKYTSRYFMLVFGLISSQFLPIYKDIDEIMSPF